MHPDIVAKDGAFRAQSAATVDTFTKMGRDNIAAQYKQFIALCGEKTILKSDTGVQRWEYTLTYIRSGKTVAEVSKIRGQTEGAIVKHLESLRALGKLPIQDIAHLARGSEQAITQIHRAFRQLNTDKLSPVFEKFSGMYSYENYG